MSQEDQKPSGNVHEILSSGKQKETTEAQQQDDLSPGPTNTVDTSNTTAGSVAQQATENQSFTLGFQQGYRTGHADGFAEGIKHAKILDEHTQHLLQQLNPQLATQQQQQQLQPEENLSSASTVDNCTDHADGDSEGISCSNILDERSQHLLQEAIPEETTLHQSQQLHPEENSSLTSAVVTWGSIAQFISAEDFQEFSKITLTNQQAQELFMLTITRLKSLDTARTLHLFFGAFGGGYFYLGDEDKSLYHSFLTVSLFVFGMVVFYRFDSSAVSILTEFRLSVSQMWFFLFLVLWGIVLFVEALNIAESARQANGQIIRDWLKDANLLEDTESTDDNNTTQN